MKNKHKPVDTMRLIRRIYRLSVVLCCLPVTALAIIMTHLYVGESIAIFYLSVVLFAAPTYILLREIVVEVAKFVWMMTDDESI